MRWGTWRHSRRSSAGPTAPEPLRYYVQNADPGFGADEAEKVIESRFLIGQMLAAAGDPDAAAVELRALRPLLADAFGANSARVRNLDKQVSRLRALG
jgi:hypothetical protein